jgi:hypothetical protein
MAQIAQPDKLLAVERASQRRGDVPSVVGSVHNGI